MSKEKVVLKVIKNTLKNKKIEMDFLEIEKMANVISKLGEIIEGYKEIHLVEYGINLLDDERKLKKLGILESTSRFKEVEKKIFQDELWYEAKYTKSNGFNFTVKRFRNSKDFYDYIENFKRLSKFEFKVVEEDLIVVI